MALKGTRTEKNLLAAFAGESQARNRYTMWAKIAGKEGYRQIEEIFLETAENERVHASRFFKFLGEGAAEITATYPFGMGDTIANLKAAATGEHEEHTRLYPDFAAVAAEEGFNDIASLFNNIAKAEVEHEKRFLALLANIENGTVFERDEPARWKCRKCGYVHEGNSAPKACPACAHPQEYFELQATNW